MTTKMRLKHQPLVYTLFAMRTTTIPNVGQCIADIHARLMQTETPFQDIIVSDTQTVALDTLAGIAADTISGIENTSSSLKSWHLINLDRDKSIVITENSVCLKVSRYTLFEDMHKILATVLGIIEDCIPGFSNVGVKRVGLRYIDVLMPMLDDDKIDLYVNKNFQPNLFGVVKGLKNQSALTTLASSAETDAGTLKFLLAKKQVVDGAIQVLPNELAESEETALDIQIQDHWRKLEDRQYFLMDIDHFITEGKSEKYNKENVLGSVKSLYKITKDIFSDVLTDYALEQYGQYEDVIQ